MGCSCCWSQFPLNDLFSSLIWQPVFENKHISLHLSVLTDKYRQGWSMKLNVAFLHFMGSTQKYKVNWRHNPKSVFQIKSSLRDRLSPGCNLAPIGNSVASVWLWEHQAPSKSEGDEQDLEQYQSDGRLSHSWCCCCILTMHFCCSHTKGICLFYVINILRAPC